MTFCHEYELLDTRTTPSRPLKYVFAGACKIALRVLQKSYKKASRKFQESFLRASTDVKELQENVKELKRVKESKRGRSSKQNANIHKQIILFH